MSGTRASMKTSCRGIVNVISPSTNVSKSFRCLGRTYNCMTPGRCARRLDPGNASAIHVPALACQSAWACRRCVEGVSNGLVAPLHRHSPPQDASAADRDQLAQAVDELLHAVVVLGEIRPEVTRLGLPQADTR